MPSRGIIFNLQPYLKQYNTENTMKNSKSIPFVLLALLLTTVSSCINSVKYEVVIPEFEKVITVKRGNVQFRKTPDYKAAKLCYICEDDTDNCCLVWSDSQVEPGYSKSSFYAMKDQTFLVVEDTADWYGVIVEGYKAYLPKKYTKEAVVEPITPEMLTQRIFTDMSTNNAQAFQKANIRAMPLSTRTDGILKDICSDTLLTACLY